MRPDDRGRFEDDEDSVSGDKTPPAINSVTKPGNRWYGLNQYLTFTVRYNEAVEVSGTPYIQLTTDNGIRLAQYYTGSGSADIGFRYRITSADSDVDGVVTDNIIRENGGTLADSAGNVADLVIGTQDTSGVYIDPVIPNLTGITNVAPGYYRHVDGDTLSFTVSFDKVVYSNTNTRIAITLGSGTAYAYYSGGTGSTDITFTYTVGDTDLDLDGITLVSPINISGSYLRDIAQNTAVRNFSVPDTSEVFVTPDSLVLWLDAAQAQTLFDNEGDDASDPAFDDVVCTWQDRSYRANHLGAHAVDGNCLSYTDAGPGGHGIVSGSGDAGSQCLSVNLNSGLASTTSASLYSVVRSDDNLQAQQTLVWGDSGVGAFPRLQTFDNLGVWNFAVGGADDYWESSTNALATGTWQVSELDFSASTYVLRLDGVSETLNLGAGVLAADTGAVSSLHLGCDANGDNNMSASFGEIFIFESVLNINARNHLRNYLNSKWSL